MRWLFFLLVLSLTLAACGEDEKTTPPKSSPTSNAPLLRVTVSEARVFAYPSRDSEVLFRLIEGDEVPVLARTEPDLIGVTWYQVGQGDQFGWIAGSQVEVSGNLALLRVVVFESSTPVAFNPDATATISPMDDPMIQVVVAEAPLFLSPQVDAEEAGKLSRGETADILGKTEASDQIFYLIGREGTVLGWIPESDVLAQGNVGEVPLFNIDEALAAVLPTQAVALQPSVFPSQTSTHTPTATQPTRTPTLTPPPVTPSASPDLAGTAQAAPTATDMPVTATTTSESTEEAAEPTSEPQIERGVPPPFKIELPAGWGAAHVLVPVSSEFVQGTLPVSLYQGPLNGGGNGFIWVVWSFPTLVDLGSGELSLYADGVQILRGVIFDSNACTISLGSERRQHTVGGHDAVGTIFSITDCPDASDTAGYFAALNVEGENFVFIVGVESLSTTDTGLPQLQAILDSIIFDIPEISE